MPEDIADREQARPVIYALSERVAGQLRKEHLCARGVQLTVKSNEFHKEDAPRQLSLFESEEERGRRQALTGALDALREKYGPGIIRRGVLMEDKKEE